ncbi:MAG: hypothetical protein GXO28_07230 [Methanopyri archaeon]|nr:hypothetical protein [Methanopyri archaeon]
MPKVEELAAAIVALEDASWEQPAREKFLKTFATKLSEYLEELGYETPEEKLAAVYGEENFEVNEEDDKVIVEVRCPCRTFKEVAEEKDYCTNMAFLEAVFGGKVEDREVGEETCTVVISKG